MEDYELMRRARRLGRIVTLAPSVITSSRRWRRLGVIRATLLSQVITFGYHLGLPPSRLIQWR
jgi:hypothetical protein